MPEPRICRSRLSEFRPAGPKLPALRVILKDVLGHSATRIASIAGCTRAAS